MSRRVGSSLLTHERPRAPRETGRSGSLTKRRAQRPDDDARQKNKHVCPSGGYRRPANGVDQLVIISARTRSSHRLQNLIDGGLRSSMSFAPFRSGAQALID